MRVWREQRRPITESQRYQIGRMMDYSDNAATDSLLAQVGLANVQRVARLMGLTATTVRGGGAAGTATWWGYSTTTAWDWLKLETYLVNGTPVLTPAERTFVRSWMSHVTQSQIWGVVLPGYKGFVNLELKNGWGPRTGGYRLNSIGHVKGFGRDYQMAMLSRAPGGFYYGRDTLNGASGIIYRELATPLA
nr:class A beta-lactamase-related serine hydrolase [Yimella sp. cx-51]